jgi:anti-sigma regulatory factor (Ser/Thr protein kinase)
VADHGVWRIAPADHTRGRGLRLIEQVMDEMTVVHGPDGTTVTMRRFRRVAP